MRFARTRRRLAIRCCARVFWAGEERARDVIVRPREAERFAWLS